MTPEGKVKAAVKRALKKNFGDMLWEFMPVQNGYGKPALDFLLCIGGRFFGLETKAPGKKPTPLQTTTMMDIQAAGGYTFVVYDDESLHKAIATIWLVLEFDALKGGKRDGQTKTGRTDGA